ncbi:MAG TPA: ABC transporter permease [Terracidiphilus sp.]|jgi:predicted permease
MDSEYPRKRSLLRPELAADIIRDVFYSVRTLARSPGFTIISLLTLALGIGANTAMFSVVQGVILASLPFPDSNRLVFLWQTRPGVSQIDVSEPNFEDWQRSSRSFEQLSALTFHNYNLSAPGTAQHLLGARVSSTFLSILKVKLALGHDFTTNDDQPTASPVALVSYRLWKERFGGNPRALGRAMVLDGRTFTLVGVLPPDFHFIDDTDVITPLLSQIPAIYRERSVDALAVVARLNPGIDIPQAESELNAVQQELDRRYPDANRNLGVSIWPIKKQLIGDVKATLLLLFGAVTLVLLIACANVANLLLVRSNMREREFGVRAALGASRVRMIRQVLTESILLSIAGGALGVGVAVVAVRLLLRVMPGILPRTDSIGLNWPVVVFALFVAIAVGILFGVVPALRSSRADVQAALQSGSRGASGGNHRLLGQFVTLQVALTLVLLAGSGMLLRSIQHLWHVNPGFDTQHMISFKVGLSPSLTSTPDGIRTTYRQLLERIRDIPGVHAADLSNLVPLSGNDNSGPFWIGATQSSSLPDAPHALYFWTGPDYLQTMGIPLLRGRFFSPADNLETPKVVVIDQVLAQTFFPGQDPVGKTLTVGHWGTAQIVGVVGHVRNWGLDDAGTYNPRQIYIPAYQLPDSMVSDFFRNLTILVRSTLPPADIVPPIRNAVYLTAPDQPVYDIRTIEELERESMASRRLPILLLGAFAGLALLLASVGVYGVVSYSASRRVREIGIRMALGADRSSVYCLILAQGLKMAALGVLVGVSAVLVLVRMLPSFSHLLYGVDRDDPLTLAIVSASMLLIALAACAIPAWRAMRTDPMASLRCE